MSVSLTRKVSLFQRDEHLDSTLLHTAALFGHERITRLLLEYSAEVNSVDTDLETPLMWAAKWGHPQVCVLLLEAGALLHLRSASGETASDKAKQAGHTAVIQAMARYEEEQHKYIDAIFAEIDTDGSGEIDREELGEYVLNLRAGHSLVLGRLEKQLAETTETNRQLEGRVAELEKLLAQSDEARSQAAEAAQFWEARHGGQAAESQTLRAALSMAEAKQRRLARRNEDHDQIVADVQASARVALKAASTAVASALDKRGAPAAASSSHRGLPKREGRRWSVSAGAADPTATGSSGSTVTVQGEEWQAAGAQLSHRNPLPLPAALLATVLEHLDSALGWVRDGGAWGDTELDLHERLTAARAAGCVSDQSALAT